MLFVIAMALDTEDRAFGAGAGSLVRGSFAKIEAAQQAAVAGFGSFLHPRRTFDQQQAIESVPVWREPTEDFVQWGKRSGNERVIRADCQNFFSARGERWDCEIQFLDDGFDGAGFFLGGFAKADGEIWPEDGQHDAGHTAAGADIQDAFSAFQQQAQLLGVEYVAMDEFFQRGMTREVHPLVPRPEQPAVMVELGDLIGRKLGPDGVA